MSRTLRRFEVLLPLRFNDGQPVPDELVLVSHVSYRSTIALAARGHPTSPQRTVCARRAL